MLYSMTGFGKGEARGNGRKYSVEIKSLNHRYCEVYVRLPGELGALEERIRAFLNDKIGRGKIEIFVRQDADGPGEQAMFEACMNKGVIKQYRESLAEIARELDIPDDTKLSALMLLPEAASIKKRPEDTEEIYLCFLPALSDAVEKLLRFRRNEGERLGNDISSKITEAGFHIRAIKEHAPEVPRNYLRLLRERLAEYPGIDKIDEQRMAQAAAVYADKCCIDEEIVRLEGHLEHFGKELENGGRIGRKLDFLIQEMNREINTIGSKANDLKITKRAVEMKCIIEQIREQVQNIE